MVKSLSPEFLGEKELSTDLLCMCNMCEKETFAFKPIRLLKLFWRCSLLSQTQSKLISALTRGISHSHSSCQNFLHLSWLSLQISKVLKKKKQQVSENINCYSYPLMVGRKAMRGQHRVIRSYSRKYLNRISQLCGCWEGRRIRGESPS